MSDAAFNEEFAEWINSLELDSVAKYNGNLPKDFFQLCCGKKLQHLCKFLIENVKDKDTATLITGNLHLHNLTLENENLQQQCNKKLEELTVANAKIQQLEEKIKKKKSSCSKLDLQLSRLEQSVLSEKVKSLLHEGHSKELKQKLQSVSNTEKYFIKVCQQRLQKNNGDAQFSFCCEEFKQLLAQVFDTYKNGFENNNASKGYSDENFGLWKASLKVLTCYPSKMIVDALINISKQDKERLSRCEDETNHDMKAEIIKETNPITTVQNMIQEHHRECLKEFQGAVDDENAASKILKTIEQTTHKIHQQMSSMDNVDEVSKVFAAEAELKGNEAYFHSLQQSIKTLQNQLDNNSLIQCEVKEMELEMKNFHKELMRNQAKILQTTQQNSEFRKRMPDYQADSASTAKALLCNQQPEFEHLCSSLQNTLKSEVSALSDADVSQLMTVDVNLKPIPIYDLSIHRPLKVAYETGNMSYQHTSSLLGVHTVKTPSDFLGDIFHKKGLADFYRSMETSNLAVQSKSQDKAKEIEAARNEMMSGHKLHLEKIRAEIRQGNAWIGILADEEAKLEEALNIWFDQPAQFQAPWLRVGGLDLNKWKQAKLSE